MVVISLVDYYSMQNIDLCYRHRKRTVNSESVKVASTWRIQKAADGWPIIWLIVGIPSSTLRGADDGSFVGDVWGLEEGTALWVGNMDGNATGATDGRYEGALLGESEGVMLAVVEGIGVGTTVGVRESEGLLEGDAEAKSDLGTKSSSQIPSSRGTAPKILSGS